MNNILSKHSSFFAFYLLFLAFGGLALYLYSKTDIFLFINLNNHQWSDYLIRYYTHVGDGWFYAAVILLLLFYRYKYALIAAVSFGVSSLAVQVLKRYVFEEFRPSRFYIDSDVKFHIIEGVKMHSNHSFPSGHTTTGFSVFCLLALIFPEKKYGFLFFVLALMVAYSRVYLAEHFFADVYAGSILGVVSTLVVFYGMDAYFKKLNKNWPERRLNF